MAPSVPDSLVHILTWDARALAHLATIGPDGEPQTSPVWFDWEEDLIEVSIYETSQKMRNIQRDSRVSLSIVDPEDPYRYIEIRGEVVHTRPDPDLKFLTRMSGKYLGLDYYPWARAEELEIVISIEPRHVVGMAD